MTSGSVARRTASVVLGVGAAVAGMTAANGYLRNWGSSDAERRRHWTGDELVAEPAVSTAKAVDVEASTEAVWRWLVQIGQDRGGWYSYEWLENLVGLRIRNTDEVRDEWQHLEPGDVVRMIPRGWLHLVREGFGLPVAIVDPPLLLVLREDPSEMPWDAVWTFAVQSQGPGRSRLVSHGREHRPPGVGPAIGRLAGMPFELLTHVMTRKMLLGIKERAERAERAGRG